MPVTKEEIRTLLNKLQNEPNNRFDFDYLSDKKWGKSGKFIIFAL